MPTNVSHIPPTPAPSTLTIAITGSSGYIGTRLQAFLRKQNHQIINISRSLLYGDTSKLQAAIKGCNIVINLAGASINQRWTKKNKETIYASRVSTTKHLITAINRLATCDRPQHVISVSAVGLYQNDSTHTETSTCYDRGFLGRVVQDWENEMQQLDPKVKLTIFRLGLVLGQGSQLIERLQGIFRWGLGASMGTGRQAFPFIHIDDLINAFEWAIINQQIGIFNLCVNKNTSNSDFTKALAKAVKRPAAFKIPAFALRLLLGEMAVIVLKSPKVDASKLERSGLSLAINTLDKAIKRSLS